MNLWSTGTSGGAEGGECKSGHLEFHVVIPIEGHVPVFPPLQWRLTNSPPLNTTRSAEPFSSAQQVLSPDPLLSKAALHSTHLKSNWKQARFSIQETIVISSNPVSRHILGSVIDDKDILIFFLFRFRVPDCGAGGC